jgi:hypothetical protein
MWCMENANTIAMTIQDIGDGDHTLEIVTPTLRQTGDHDPRPRKKAKHMVNIKVVSTPVCRRLFKTVTINDAKVVP